MSDSDFTPGAVKTVGENIECRYERIFEHPQAAVWATLTAPDKYPQWLAPGSIELKANGAVNLDFQDSGIVVDSTVTAFKDGSLLEYSWSGKDGPHRPLRWELSPEGNATKLVLTVTVPKSEDAAKSFAGFEGHLIMFEAVLEGVSVKFPFEIYKAARKAYADMLA